MDNDLSSRMELLIEQALTLPPGERTAFIDRECGSDDELRKEINSLLQYGDKAFSFVRDFSENIMRPSLSELPDEGTGDNQKIDTFVRHYHITEKLGEGGMGVVYKAEDSKLKRSVAIKFLPPELTRDPTAKERFIYEAQAASALDHPNICTIHEINETDDGQIFIAMACYEGESLKEKIERGPLSVDGALDVAIQIARGLAKAHSKKIIHRDIKPANILITDEGQVKIIDFGLAKLTGRTGITRTGSVMGTVAYMSPEQAQGTNVDHRTDIWSLGIILYEMLTGAYPFKGEYDQAVIYSIINEDLEPMPGVSMEIEQIVNKALAKIPDERYQHLDNLVYDLKAIGKQHGTETKITPPFFAKYSAKNKTHLYGGVASLLVLTVVILLYLFASPGKAIDSIAVLPLINLSGDPEQEYFADGMTEALTAELGQISALKVISRTSAMRYKNSNKSITEIARELNVDGLVEGSVFPAGEEIRVTIQLIDGSTDQHIWSASYQRHLRDILVLQNEIASDVAGKIHVSVSPEEQRRLATIRTVDPEAYRFYLVGNHHLNSFSLQEALDSYQEAVELDPGYAPAYAGIAMTTIEMGTWWGSSPPQEVLPKARATVNRALDLDPTTAVAYMALGSIEFLFEWDWKSAEDSFKWGMELNPGSSYFRIKYANFLTAMGRFEESIEIGRNTLELDPLSPAVYNELGFALQLAGHDDEALEYYKQSLRIDPNFLQSHELLAGFYMETGEPQKALGLLAYADSIKTTSPTSGMGLTGYYYAMAGEQEKAQTILSHLIELNKNQYVPAIAFFDLYLGLGEIQESLSWLEKAFEERNVGLVWLNVAPEYDTLRDEPRFQEVLKQMNFPEGNI